MRAIAVFPGKFQHSPRQLAGAGRLLAHLTRGLESYGEMLRLLTEKKGAIKVFVEVGAP